MKLGKLHSRKFANAYRILDVFFKMLHTCFTFDNIHTMKFQQLYIGRNIFLSVNALKYSNRASTPFIILFTENQTKIVNWLICYTNSQCIQKREDNQGCRVMFCARVQAFRLAALTYYATKFSLQYQRIENCELWLVWYSHEDIIYPNRIKNDRNVTI